jgi:hypothetical protein
MSKITARFDKSPASVRRYLIDYTLDLATGESISSIAAPTVTSPSGEESPTLVINNIVLAPAVNGVVNQATFFASGGTSGQTYEVEFLATTSIGQIFDTVIAFTVQVKT